MLYHKKNSLQQKLKGFLIAEVVVASFILTFGLVAAVKLLAGSLSDSFSNRDVIIATELAQEGVELVRNVRDNNMVNGGDGFDNFPSSGHKHCHFNYGDSFGDLDRNCTGNIGSLAQYYLQYVGNFYIHNSNVREKFSRYIYIDQNSAGSGQKNAVVRSFVYWVGAGSGSFSPVNNANRNVTNCTLVNKCVFTEAVLTNWKE